MQLHNVKGPVFVVWFVKNFPLYKSICAYMCTLLDRNSAELNKLRSEYAGMMKELADNSSKLQQEEHQRKTLEVTYKQNVSQLEVR